MFKEYPLCLGRPETAVLLADLVQLLEQRVSFAQLAKVLDGSQRHVELGVGQLLAARNLWQVQGSVNDAVNTAYMSYHNSWLNAPLGCQVVGLNQIVIVAAGGANDMLAGVPGIDKSLGEANN